ncbi:hypothetical protein ACVNP1_01710 [Staphylococcus aureus]
MLYQLADMRLSRYPKICFYLPTHPYQINVLRQHPHMQYSEQGLIKDLHVPVISTQHMGRNCLFKSIKRFFKNKEYVRITNFIH